MSPIFHRHKGYVFKIFSNEEERLHIHVVKAEKEAKFWLEPEVELAMNYGYNSKELTEIKEVIVTYADEFKSKYIQHIGKRIND
jgi:hypothetical protein